MSYLTDTEPFYKLDYLNLTFLGHLGVYKWRRKSPLGFSHTEAVFDNLSRYYCDIVPRITYCDHSEVIRTDLVLAISVHT